MCRNMSCRFFSKIRKPIHGEKKGTTRLINDHETVWYFSSAFTETNLQIMKNSGIRKNRPIGFMSMRKRPLRLDTHTLGALFVRTHYKKNEMERGV